MYSRQVTHAGDDSTTPLETGWVQMPSSIKERALELQRKIRALNSDIDRAVVAGKINPDSGRYAAWKGFVNGYGRWLGEVGGGSAPDWIKWGWSDIAATLETKASDLRDWFSWFARVSGPPSTTPPRRRGDPTLPGLNAEPPAWLWVVGVGVAAWGGAALIRAIKR